jgi:hypothetical protein
MLGAYLIVAGAAMLATFDIPLLVAPMSWARLMRWEVPPPGQLVTFLGRSLGLFICVVAAYAFKAAATPQAQPFFFELMLWLFVSMIGLHVYGAIKKVQTPTVGGTNKKIQILTIFLVCSGRAHLSTGDEN